MMADAKRSTPAEVMPPRAEQIAQTTEVEADVVLSTTAFDVRKPVLLDQAEQLFRAKVAETYGDKPLINVRLIKVNHHIGTSALYKFAAEISG